MRSCSCRFPLVCCAVIRHTRKQQKNDSFRMIRRSRKKERREKRDVLIQQTAGFWIGPHRETDRVQSWNTRSIDPHVVDVTLFSWSFSIEIFFMLKCIIQISVFFLFFLASARALAPIVYPVVSKGNQSGPVLRLLASSTIYARCSRPEMTNRKGND